MVNKTSTSHNSTTLIDKSNVKSENNATARPSLMTNFNSFHTNNIGGATTNHSMFADIQLENELSE